MNSKYEEVVEFLCLELASVTRKPRTAFNDASALLGPTAVVASLGIVEVLLAAEDYATERLGFAFDWTSDNAMSDARSHFRTVGSLAEHLLKLAEPQPPN